MATHTPIHKEMGTSTCFVKKEAAPLYLIKEGGGEQARQSALELTERLSWTCIFSASCYMQKGCKGQPFQFCSSYLGNMLMVILPPHHIETPHENE